MAPSIFFRKHITKACKHPTHQRNTQVPDVAVDQCELSYKAADGNKQKVAMDSFDDTGVMALICHHNIPLFFTNIDTPGEQQKYSIALIKHLFSFLPRDATISIFYDVGCIIHHSLQQVCRSCVCACNVTDHHLQYDILNSGIVSWLQFATTAMHAYGHEWACQLVYNPHLAKGLGLLDGEGMEWLWSHLIKLISIEHVSLVCPPSYSIEFLSVTTCSGSATSGYLLVKCLPLVLTCRKS